MDGVVNNCFFMSINVVDKNSRMVKNFCNYEENVVFFMDYLYVVKKIRYYLLVSDIKKGCI